MIVDDANGLPMGVVVPRRKKRTRLGFLIGSGVAAMVSSSFSLTSTTVLVATGLCKRIEVAEGFCPRTAFQSSSRVPPPWKASRSQSSTPVTNEGDGDGNFDDDNAFLHEQIKQADPDWYREYVSDLLGEEYCSDRWPKIDLPVLEALTEDESEMQTDEQLEETIERLAATTATTLASEGAPEEGEAGESTPEPVSEEISMETEEASDLEAELTVAIASDVDAKDEAAAAELLEPPRLETTDSAETTATKTGETPSEDVSSEKTNDSDKAVVYRNITGKTMTCVPLGDLLDLGYVVSDLERIQAEFLSIVVLDRRPCPSMGIPPQWKIKDPRAAAEITLVDSMEEGAVMADRINQEERKERDSVDQRRRRQQDRKKGAPRSDSDGSGVQTRQMAEKKRRQSPSEDEYRRTRRSESSLGDRQRQQQQRRRRREGVGPDGTPRKIYRVPRDDTRMASSIERDDPPDPDSPLWVNMDTFRDLLQREAEFRMNFIGEDWSEVIEQENDWRSNLYKKWLWSLNDGVGESIVPPSRYERARRNNPAPTRKRRPMPREDDELRRRGRRRVSNDPPRRESRPLRGGEAPLKQQRRPKRAPGREPPVAAEDNASERRSRRRSERRRGPPGSENY